MTTLDAAVAALREALGLLSAIDMDPVRASALASLGVTLLERFAQTNLPDDIDAAVAALDTAGAAAIAEIHYARAAALMARFRYRNDQTDLDEAIVAGQRAVNLLPTGHPDRAPMLCNLAVSQHARFSRNG